MRCLPRSLSRLSIAATSVFLVAAPAAQAATVWSNTATQAITPSKLISATDEGAVPASQVIIVRMARKLHHQTALRSYINSINIL